MRAGEALGWRRTSDFNGPQPEGVGFYRITTREGRRWSAADAFLRPAVRRRNVKVETHAWARKILFEGKRAVGIEYSVNGQIRRALAAREVVVCAGAVSSPQLLQLSGVGPPPLLSKLAIGCVAAHPAVGGYLQDHLAITYSFRATRSTLNDELHSAAGKLRAGLRYLLTRRGALALSVNHCGGFVRTAGAIEPDVQLYFNPVSYAPGDALRPRINVDRFSGFMLSAQPSRPSSRGRVDVVSGASATRRESSRTIWRLRGMWPTRSRLQSCCRHCAIPMHCKN